MRYEKLLLRMIVCACLVQPSVVSAGAVTVPPAARATAAEAAEAAQAVLYKERAVEEREESREYSVKAENIAQEVEDNLGRIRIDLAEKKLVLPKLEQSEQETATAYTAVKKQLEDARQAAGAAWAEATAGAKKADYMAASLPSREEVLADLPDEAATYPTAKPYVPKESDQLLLMEDEIRQQEMAQRGQSQSDDLPARSSLREEALAELEAARASVNHAYTAANRLQGRAEELDQIAQVLQVEAEKRMVDMQAAYEAAAKMRQNIADGEYILGDTTTTAQSARKESDRAKTSYAKVIDTQENPLPYRYASTGLQMYSWSSQGDHGYQIISPFLVSYFRRKGEYSDGVGLAFDYIISSTNVRGRKSRMKGLSDTTLYLNRSRELEKYIINYTLTVNIPTGKASLSESECGARMSEDLAKRSMFGEGWNFTPEFSVSRKIGKEDVWTAGVSYSWRGAYDPTTDIANDDLTPGNQWRKFLRWRHAGQSWQFVGELAHVTTAAGRITDGTRYDTGAEWLTRLTYRRVLPKRQDLVLYYWYDRETAKTAQASFVASPAHYFGAVWGKELDDKRKIRLSLDMMVATGARYESLYNNFVDRRDKQTIGIGYDLKLSATRKLSLDAQIFRMKDGRNTMGENSRRYKGWNVFVTYGGTF